MSGFDQNPFAEPAVFNPFAVSWIFIYLIGCFCCRRPRTWLDYWRYHEAHSFCVIRIADKWRSTFDCNTINELLDVTCLVLNWRIPPSSKQSARMRLKFKRDLRNTTLLRVTNRYLSPLFPIVLFLSIRSFVLQPLCLLSYLASSYQSPTRHTICTGDNSRADSSQPAGTECSCSRVEGIIVDGIENLAPTGIDRTIIDPTEAAGGTGKESPGAAEERGSIAPRTGS